MSKALFVAFGKVEPLDIEGTIYHFRRFGLQDLLALNEIIQEAWDFAQERLDNGHFNRLAVNSGVSTILNALLGMPLVKDKLCIWIASTMARADKNEAGEEVMVQIKAEDLLDPEQFPLGAESDIALKLTKHPDASRFLAKWTAPGGLFSQLTKSQESQESSEG